MAGKKTWFIVDGYRPPKQENGVAKYEGHEAIMILNCNKTDAHCLIDVFYEDKAPITGIKYTAPAQRISCFRTDDKCVFGDVELKVCEQYSLRVRSDIDVIVQYGRADVNQTNLAYIGLLGYSE